MLTKSQCSHMTDAELVRAERAFRVEIRRELKRRRVANRTGGKTQ